MALTLGQMGKDRQVTAMIQQHMQLHSTLGLPEFGGAWGGLRLGSNLNYYYQRFLGISSPHACLGSAVYL